MIAVSAKFVPRDDLGRFVETFISPAVYAAVQTSCEHVQQLAQGFCPVDTGALRDSITIDGPEEIGKTVAGRVGPHMPYAEFVEYGTYKMAAQPYMRPALDESKPVILDVFRNNIREALA